MKTVLIYTSPARGHLYPIMDIALELKTQGYRVVVQSLKAERPVVEAEGIEYLDISPAIEALPLEDYQESNPIRQIKSAFQTWAKRAAFEIEDLKESYRKIQPDFLMIDVNTWGAAAFAESLQRPWGIFHPYCLLLASNDTPAFGPGFLPPQNILHQLRDKMVRKLVDSAIKSPLQEMNEIREELGVSPFRKYEDIFSRPNLIFYRTAEPFDYSRKFWPQNVLQLGPGLWAPKAEKPEWIEELPHPRILVSVSTEKQNDAQIIESALEGLAGDEYGLIITTGAQEAEKFHLSNGNTRLCKFLPHSAVIDEVDLLVSHGGMGSTQRALAAGVPVCVVPCGRDQRETARRVEYNQSGVMLPLNKLNGSSLKKAVKAALRKKEGAQKIAKAFAEKGGAKKAVLEIEKLVA
ncbi:MAG: glycosyltransferase [Calditrichia bacterium]